MVLHTQQPYSLTSSTPLSCPSASRTRLHPNQRTFSSALKSAADTLVRWRESPRMRSGGCLQHEHNNARERDTRGTVNTRTSGNTTRESLSTSQVSCGMTDDPPQLAANSSLVMPLFYSFSRERSLLAFQNNLALVTASRFYHHLYQHPELLYTDFVLLLPAPLSAVCAAGERQPQRRCSWVLKWPYLFWPLAS